MKASTLGFTRRFLVSSMARTAERFALALLVANVALAQAPLGPNPFDQFIPRKREVGMLDGSYAKCLLDKLPGVANDVAAQQIAAACFRSFPDGFNTVEEGSTLFGYSTAAECVIKKARDTPSRQAAYLISYACHHRYPPQ